MSNNINEDKMNPYVDTAHEPERRIDFSSFIGQKNQALAKTDFSL